MMLQQRPVWGICGCGGIAADFAAALRANNSNVGAVAARSNERAKQFAERFAVDVSYGNYADLFADSRITVIYIATIKRRTHLWCWRLWQQEKQCCVKNHSL